MVTDTVSAIHASVLATKSANNQALFVQNKHAQYEDNVTYLACEFEDAHSRALHKRAYRNKSSASSSVKPNNTRKKVPCHIRKKQEAAAAKAHSAAMARRSNKKQTSKERKAKRLAKEENRNDFLLRPLSASSAFGGSPIKTAGCSASPLPEAEIGISNSISAACVLPKRAQRQSSFPDSTDCIYVQPALPSLDAIPLAENKFALLAEVAEDAPIPQPIEESTAVCASEGFFWRTLRFVGGLIARGAAVVVTACGAVKHMLCWA